MQPPVGITASVTPVEDNRSIRVSYEISLTEMFLYQNRQNMLDRVMDECGRALAMKVVERIEQSAFDHLIDDAIKNAIRDEVRKAVAEKVDDFIQEILS